MIYDGAKITKEKILPIWSCAVWLNRRSGRVAEARLKTRSPTLLDKSPVDNPDGALKRSGDGRWRMASRTAVAAHRLDAPEKEYHDAHHGDGRGDARPDGQVKRRQQGENVDLLLRLAHQDSHRVVQIAFAEIHHTLALRGDGDGWYGQVSALWMIYTIHFGYWLTLKSIFKGC